MRSKRSSISLLMYQSFCEWLLTAKPCCTIGICVRTLLQESAGFAAALRVKCVETTPHGSKCDGKWRFVSRKSLIVPYSQLTQLITEFPMDHL